MVDSKKNASATAKTKRSSVAGKDKVCNSQEYGENLVGSKIKVWWPIDREFYYGVVDAFCSREKKHHVLYKDGDKETLDMKKEKWEVVEDDEYDDASADKISLNEESGEESSEATQESVTRKSARSVGWKVIESASRTRTIKEIYEATNPSQTRVSDKVTKPSNSSKKNKEEDEDEAGDEEPSDDNSNKKKGNKPEDEDGDDDEESYDDESKKNNMEDEKGGDDNESSDINDSNSKKNMMVDKESANEELSDDGYMNNKTEDEDGGDKNEKNKTTDSSSDDDSQLLCTFVKKIPKAMKAIMDKPKKKGDDEDEDEEAPEKKQKR